MVELPSSREERVTSGPALQSGSLAATLEPHLPALRRRALQLCRRPPDADDLVQETALRALRFEQSFTAGTHLRAWLMRILWSVYITNLRRRSVERRFLELVGQDPNFCAGSTAAPELVDLFPPVARAVGSLPQAFAEVVRLVDVEELSYEQASALLSVPVGTVMSRLHRGRRLLRQKLGREPLPRAA